MKRDKKIKRILLEKIGESIESSIVSNFGGRS